MNSIIYVGMDVHSTSYTLCTYSINDDQYRFIHTISPNLKSVLNYLDMAKEYYGEGVEFICGYEAGCLGYSLYRTMTKANIKCIILAPTSIPEKTGNKKRKNDKRDARKIAKCLANKDYSAVYVPTEEDEAVKDYIRMRSDVKLMLKKNKQQILSLCLRHDYHYNDGNNWTQKHLTWIKSLEWKNDVLKETIDEYLSIYEYCINKLERLDSRIEELAQQDRYQESVRKLCCFIGIKTLTALSFVVETGDFKRFDKANKYSAYLGVIPGENSSGNDINGLSITKAGNTHLRHLLVEAAQGYTRGTIGKKSKELKRRQSLCDTKVVTYADKANERLRRKYYRMTLKNNAKRNVAVTAVARELSCFIWGMMTESYAS